MIKKAQFDAEDIDPLYQVGDLYKEDLRRRKMEEKLNNYMKMWFGKLETTNENILRTLGENEMKEYRSRIAILAAEINHKNQIIDGINKERER